MTDQHVSLDHHSLVALNFPNFDSFNRRYNKRYQQILLKIILTAIDNTNLTGDNWIEAFYFVPVVLFFKMNCSGRLKPNPNRFV